MSAESPAPRRALAHLAVAACITIPVSCLVVAVLAWLRYGIDFPLWDDWRDYILHEAGSLDPAFLFRPANDTLFPVGRLLDSLAFRFLGGNTVAYQLISMVGVLGSLLLLQWKLLRLACEDRVTTAALFTLTVVMLQPESYWGWQNIAYHQALPLVCMLAALVLVLGRTWRSAIDAPLVFVLGLVSGLVYISGAFATLVTAVVVLGASVFIAQPDRVRFRHGGLALLLAGVPSTLAQLWVIVFVQAGTHRADAPMAMPTESDFWFYLLGKIGRALMLPASWPTFSLVSTLTFVAVTGVLGVLVLKRLLASKPATLHAARAVTVFVSLLGVIGVYLLMVSAGRTNLRPAEVTDPLQVFSFGFLRFHYFWVTLVLPWVAAIGLMAIGSRTTAFIPVLPPWFAILVAGIVLVGGGKAGAWQHPRYFRQTEALRLESIQCLALSREAGVNVPCSRDILDVPLHAFRYGIERGASFANTVPLRMSPLHSRPPAFHMDAPGWLSAERRDAEIASSNAHDVEFETAGAPELVVNVADNNALHQCGVADVVMAAQFDRAGEARLYYLPASQQEFSDASSVPHSVPVSTTPIEIHFLLRSAKGFRGGLKIATPPGTRRFSLGTLEIRCLEAAPIEAPYAIASAAGTRMMRPSAPLSNGAMRVTLSPAHIAGALPLRKVDILFGTWGRRNEGTAELRLTRANGEVFTTRFDLAGLQNNAYRAFVVDPGRYVSAEIAPVTGGGVSVWESVAETDGAISCVVYEYTNGNQRFTPGCPIE